MPSHGTPSVYLKGCRCDLCRAWNAERMRKIRARGVTDGTWMKYRRVPDVVLEGAACKGKPADWWFPLRGVIAADGSSGNRYVKDPGVAQAFAICDACPVKAECLTHALDAPEKSGIWGGTTERERRVLRRQRRQRRAAVSTAGTADATRAPVPHQPAPGSTTEKRWPRHVNNGGHHTTGERLA